MLPNRVEAGRLLAKKLLSLPQPAGSCVISLPRGGVVVGDQIARELGLPMDILVVRKIGMAGHSEYAIGAISEHGETFLDNETIKEYRVSWDYIEREIHHQKEHLEEYKQSFSLDRKRLDLAAQNVIIADDGLATGHTMRVAIQDIRKQRAKSITVAIPVGPKETVLALKALVDRVVVLNMPRFFFAVGHHYTHFPQVETAEVVELLRNADKSLRSEHS